MTTIYKGDNTGAFDAHFITIELNNPEGYTISKTVFVCGTIKKTFESPIFPLVINFTDSETKQLNSINICYLVVYDSQNRQKTLKETVKFMATGGVINE